MSGVNIIYRLIKISAGICGDRTAVNHFSYLTTCLDKCIADYEAL
ncbi:hypothetical protein [Chlorogloea sp. CCALA 695]|nr:hypothetical protein [Chlorogloea sp. CCALA 695]